MMMNITTHWNYVLSFRSIFCGKEMTDINTTKYLYKPNVETIRYFVNDWGSDIAEQVEQNT